ncbi:MAG: hypothetical protein AMXMBFR20_29470 [Planctomycetia bacterium]
MDTPAATTPRPNSDARENAQDRRADNRRESPVDRRAGLERRRGPGRRRSDSRRSAEEGELNSEQFEFVMAMDEYKRANKKPFPSWTEVLEVLKYLGYRKVADVGEHVDRPATED